MQRFHVGQRVRTRPVEPTGHTRLPRYLAERLGTIERVHGFYPLADERARGEPGTKQALYCVVFEASELWRAEGGAESGAGDGFTVAADLWDAYLDEVTP